MEQVHIFSRVKLDWTQFELWKDWCIVHVCINRMQAVCLPQENSCSCSMADVLRSTSICSHMQLVLYCCVGRLVFSGGDSFYSRLNTQIPRQSCCSHQEDVYHPHCAPVSRDVTCGGGEASDTLGSASLPFVMLLIFPSGDGTETYEPSEREKKTKNNPT